MSATKVHDLIWTFAKIIHSIALEIMYPKRYNEAMERDTQYQDKTLSETDNPKWHTLVSLCVAMGLNLRLS